MSHPMLRLYDGLDHTSLELCDEVKALQTKLNPAVFFPAQRVDLDPTRGPCVQRCHRLTRQQSRQPSRETSYVRFLSVSGKLLSTYRRCLFHGLPGRPRSHASATRRRAEVQRRDHRLCDLDVIGTGQEPHRRPGSVPLRGVRYLTDEMMYHDLNDDQLTRPPKKPMVVATFRGGAGRDR
jgi:hypothetical protein